MNYKVKKIKISDSAESFNHTIEMKFEKIGLNNEVIAEAFIKTHKIPSKDLVNAILDLNMELRVILEIPIESDRPMVVKQINFREDEEKGLGIDLQGEIRLFDSDSPLVFKIPTKWQETDLVTQKMSENLYELIEEIQLLANEFLNKERSYQLDLFNKSA